MTMRRSVRNRALKARSEGLRMAISTPWSLSLLVGGGSPYQFATDCYPGHGPPMCGSELMAALSVAGQTGTRS